MIYFIGEKSLMDAYPISSVEDCIKYFQDKRSIAVDTETQGRNPHSKDILSLQLGDAERQYVIDCRSVDILQFKPLLETKKIILHNAKFDYKFLKHDGIIVEDVWDTMLAECVLYCGYEKYGYGLDKLVQRYCDVELSKDTRGDFFKLTSEPFTAEQIRYAATDVRYLHEIATAQHHKLQDLNLLYAANLEFQAVKALADIEYNGMPLDKDMWMANAQDYSVKLGEAVKQLDEIVLSDSILKEHYKALGILNLFDYEERQLEINYASPKQVLTLLNRLGLFPPNTNARELTKLKNKHPIINVLDSYREYAKVISTYGEGFLDNISKITGRIHTDFWQILNTYRISSNDPNLQNIPKTKEFRNCFRARDGYSWLSIDYSSQELRLMADYSDEDGFIDVLNRGEDLHCFAGTMMFKKPVTKEDKDLRDKAKTINFGKPYGMGPPKLADTLQISIEEAESLFKEYGLAFPKLNAWLDSQAKFGLTNGYIRLNEPHNGIRWFKDIDIAKQLRQSSNPDWREIFIIEGKAQRDSMNTGIQGIGAVICKEALVVCRELLKSYDGLMLPPVHDELNFEIRDDQVQEFADRAAKLMTEVGNKYVTKVQMEVDVKITKYWTK